ncbi:tyrosine-type recombinase/integrase [Sphingomonas sp. CCH10-B3]|uniref:tyrosine-type recombinase/integrase n=1 Tax=Sphingomonas sp. CCH10-B3 TaxID=1768757 RepID=UPI00082BD7E9|nr:integrase arm-type DNA-binding domain-containing protein [Sphingomonas sp. CCH10-B3]
MLNDLACRQAKPRDKAYKLADEKGLHLLVLPTGSKSWRQKYRFDGKEKQLTHGPYPEVSLAQARALRDSARAVLREGRDPGVLKRIGRAHMALAQGTSLRAVTEEWHAMRKPNWAPRYADQILDRFENHLFPLIGSMPIADITAPQVLQAIRAIEATGAREMAHRVRQHLSDVFVHAIATGRATHDPAATIQRALAPVSRQLRPAATRIEHARQILRKVELQPAYRLTKLASRLLALTAARPGVIRLAERHEFEDLDSPAPVWRISAEKMKLTRERKRDAAFEFAIPLSTQAVDVVRAVLALSGPTSPWLFPAATKRSVPISDSTLSGLYLASGFRGVHVPHGWRATFSTVMNERAAIEDRPGDRAIIDLMLAHVQEGVEAAYNRALYMPRRREIAQAWADLLMKDMAPARDLLG